VANVTYRLNRTTEHYCCGFLVRIDGEPSVLSRTVDQQVENCRGRPAQARSTLAQQAGFCDLQEHADPDLIPIEARPESATKSIEEVADEIGGINMPQ
jgi:hypothetical protein